MGKSEVIWETGRATKDVRQRDDSSTAVCCLAVFRWRKRKGVKMRSKDKTTAGIIWETTARTRVKKKEHLWKAFEITPRTPKKNRVYRFNPAREHNQRLRREKFRCAFDTGDGNNFWIR